MLCVDDFFDHEDEIDLALLVALYPDASAAERAALLRNHRGAARRLFVEAEQVERWLECEARLLITSWAEGLDS